MPDPKGGPGTGKIDYCISPGEGVNLSIVNLEEKKNEAR